MLQLLISKAVYFVISPLGLFCMALLAWGACARRARAGGLGRVGEVSTSVRLSVWAKRFAGAALAWMLVWSTPAASDALCGWLEGQAGSRSLEDVPVLPYAVVLGGGVDGPRLPQRPYPDLTSASDRLWHAARLYKAGKVKTLVLAGGVLPSGDGSEAQAMQQVLMDFGVPQEALLTEDASLNTQGNAKAVRALLADKDVRRIVLVTSALHMRRAKSQFERAGFEVVPAAADFEVVPMPLTPFRFLPDVAALADSTRAMKEVVGYCLGR